MDSAWYAIGEAALHRSTYSIDVVGWLTHIESRDGLCNLSLHYQDNRSNNLDHTFQLSHYDLLEPGLGHQSVQTFQLEVDWSSWMPSNFDEGATDVPVAAAANENSSCSMFHLE